MTTRKHFFEDKIGTYNSNFDIQREFGVSFYLGMLLIAMKACDRLSAHACVHTIYYTAQIAAIISVQLMVEIQKQQNQNNMGY